MSGRLDVVLRLRALEERRALGAATLAHLAVIEADDEVGEARSRYEQRPAAEGPVGVGELMALRLLGQGALEAVHTAAAGADQARHRHTEAQQVVLAASMKRKSAERLVERRAAEARQSAEIAERREVDERNVLRFGRNRDDNA